MAQTSISGRYHVITGAQGVDKLIVFEDLSASDAYISYKGNATPAWKDFSGRLIQQGAGAEDLYPEDATGYMLYEDGTLLETIYVLDYRRLRADFSTAVLTAEADCEQTKLTLTASLPELAYNTPNGQRIVLPREAIVHYATLSWNGEQYQDSLVADPIQLSAAPQQTFMLPAVYRNTEFKITTDDFSQGWSTEADSIESEEVQAVAIVMHPVSITTSRDYNGLGIENEPGRPIDEGTLQGSAPLEINFKTNANKPVAEFFRWKIYKGSDLLVERFDEDQRYTFLENGSYQVRCWAYNGICTSDSSVFDISVSESLLRVPNAFTPNGDGFNDEFRVVYRSLAEFHCWIYNRWGKLVYKWDDPAKGWDGTINGRPAAEGAYYYIIRARGTDAEPGAKYHKATVKRPAAIGVYQLSGHINLLR